MTRIITSVAVAALFGTMAVAEAQMPGQPARGMPANAPPVHATQPGPYAVTVESDPSLKTHTLYRPTDVKAVQGKMPIVGWGNGGCLNAGLAHEPFLRQIASNGFFVVVIGPPVGPPSLAGMKPGQPLPPLSPEMQSKTSQLLDGVNWAIAENARKDSPYYGKLDPTQIAVMGQSCGGMQAIVASADPRVKTAVIWNSGVLSGTGPNGIAMPAVKDDLKKFHAPVAYVIGGPSDIAYTAAEDDFKSIEGVPVFSANINTGHGGTFNQPNGGWYGEVGVAWLSWQLKGDKTAEKMFVGDKCGLCTDSAWTIKKKNMK